MTRRQYLRYLRIACVPLAVLVLLTGCSEDANPPAGAGHETSGISEAAAEKPVPAAPDASGGESDQGGATNDGPVAGSVELATATIEPASGSDVQGTVRFERTDDDSSMLIDVDISGLPPGKHGLHIHETGDCSAPDAESAGGHFNPYATHHGSPDSSEHHLGDLGNIDAGDDGRAVIELHSDELAFSGTASVLQKAVVVHADEDDLKSDPSGNAGARIGCGVIEQKEAISARPASAPR